MNYYSNPISLLQKLMIKKEKNQNLYFSIITFSFILLLIFPSQNLIAQIPAKCVGSTSTQKFSGSMRPNDFLTEGQNLTSANGKFHLRVTTQGELVIEEIIQSQTCGICNEQIVMRAGREIWKAPAAGRLNNPPKVSIFNMNRDCNLCFDSKQNKGWCATNGIDENKGFLWKCDKVILTNEGRLVLIDKDRKEIWSNTSPRSTVASNAGQNPSNNQNTNPVNNPINNQGTNPTNNPSTNPPFNQDELHISNSDLREKVTNIKHNVVNTSTKGGVSQDKSNLEMGSRVCLNLSDGTSARAMVVGQGLYYGPNQDSYAIDIIEGPHRGQRHYMKPYQIDRVGACAEDYIPAPSKTPSPNLDLNLLERKMIDEINIVRADPRSYADELAKLKFTKFGTNNNSFHAIAIGNDLTTRCYDNNQSCQQKELQKLQVAIDYLRSLPKSLPLLKPNTNLSKASAILASDQGQFKGHTDSQGRSPGCRAELAAYRNSMMGECLDSGHTTAAGFVISLLMSPPHRNILMNDQANEIGIDVHRHGTGDSAYLRDVVMTGNSNYPDEPGSCQQ